jgi:acid phosphatase
MALSYLPVFKTYNIIPHFLALLLMWCSSLTEAQAIPRPDHIVIVVEENKSFVQIIGNPTAPYINSLAKRGTLFTQSYGVTHPSQPNYLALFSGATHSIVSNACPLVLSGGNLASALIEKGLSFASFAESMPYQGFDGCIHDAYFRKHNPAANWVQTTAFNLPISAFPQDFEKLPTVSLVIPDQRNDMHDGSIAEGDAWLVKNIENYARWAMTHNSLLIVTWDEDDGSGNNHVATIFTGEMVKSGNSAQRVNHYNILRTIEEMFGLAYLGDSARVKTIDGIWQEK